MGLLATTFGIICFSLALSGTWERSNIVIAGVGCCFVFTNFTILLREWKQDFVIDEKGDHDNDSDDNDTDDNDNDDNDNDSVDDELRHLQPKVQRRAHRISVRS